MVILGLLAIPVWFICEKYKTKQAKAKSDEYARRNKEQHEALCEAVRKKEMYWE